MKTALSCGLFQNVSIFSPFSGKLAIKDHSNARKGFSFSKAMITPEVKN